MSQFESVDFLSPIFRQVVPNFHPLPENQECIARSDNLSHIFKEKSFRHTFLKAKILSHVSERRKSKMGFIFFYECSLSYVRRTTCKKFSANVYSCLPLVFALEANYATLTWPHRLKWVPDQCVEVIVATEEQTAAVAEGDASDPGISLLLVHLHFLVRSNVEQTNCGIVRSRHESVSIRKVLQRVKGITCIQEYYWIQVLADWRLAKKIRIISSKSLSPKGVNINQVQLYVSFLLVYQMSI